MDSSSQINEKNDDAEVEPEIICEIEILDSGIVIQNDTILETTSSDQVPCETVVESMVIYWKIKKKIFVCFSQLLILVKHYMMVRKFVWNLKK